MRTKGICISWPVWWELWRTGCCAIDRVWGWQKRTGIWPRAFTVLCLFRAVWIQAKGRTGMQMFPRRKTNSSWIFFSFFKEVEDWRWSWDKERRPCTEGVLKSREKVQQVRKEGNLSPRRHHWWLSFSSATLSCRLLMRPNKMQQRQHTQLCFFYSILRFCFDSLILVTAFMPSLGIVTNPNYY